MRFGVLLNFDGNMLDYSTGLTFESFSLLDFPLGLMTASFIVNFFFFVIFFAHLQFLQAQLILKPQILCTLKRNTFLATIAFINVLLFYCLIFFFFAITCILCVCLHYNNSVRYA